MTLPLSDSGVCTTPVTAEIRLDKEAGVKFDEGKARWDLLPFDGMKGVLEVFGKGAIKYDDRNWEKGMDHSRLFAACHRHLAAYWQGEDHDPEFGTHHLDHAIVCLLMLRTLILRGKGEDNRP